MKKELRSKKIDVRFTEDEYRSVEEMEQTLGISKANLIRKRLLNEDRSIVLNAKELIRTLDEIGAELGRSGNNINQLAHYANLLKLKQLLVPDIAERFLNMLSAYIGQQQSLEATLRSVIRQLKS